MFRSEDQPMVSSVQGRPLLVCGFTFLLVATRRAAKTSEPRACRNSESCKTALESPVLLYRHWHANDQISFWAFLYFCYKLLYSKIGYIFSKSKQFDGMFWSWLRKHQSSILSGTLFKTIHKFVQGRLRFISPASPCRAGRCRLSGCFFLCRLVHSSLCSFIVRGCKVR
jgi:hypothetical protein